MYFKSPLSYTRSFSDDAGNIACGFINISTWLANNYTLTRLVRYNGCEIVLLYRPSQWAVTIYFIHPNGKLKLSFDRTTKNISQ